MIRVSQEMFYRQTAYDLLRMQAGQYVLNGQASSGKRINQPSDDAVGAITTQGANRALEEMEQYGSNLGMVKDWLQQSDSSLGSMNDLMTRAKETAEQLSTGTITEDQRSALAGGIQGVLDELITLGNTQVNGRYIFAGTRTASPAVSSAMQVQTPATVVGTHAGDGRLYGQGAYSGLLSRDITLTVGAGYPGGAPSALNPMDIDYSYVDDFGRNISGTVTLTGTGQGQALDLGDGVQVYADAQTFNAGETFTMQVGRNRGNDEAIYGNLSQNSRLQQNYTLDQLWGDEGNAGGQWSNILDQMARWQDALDKDGKVQTYFEAVPGTANDRSDSGSLRVSGDWTDLVRRDYKFFVGGPIQSSSPDADLRNYRNFTVDPAYAGGEPSAANPMNLNYEYWDGGAWVADTAVVTGTGAGSPVALNGGFGVSINLVQADYNAGEVLPMDTYPPQPAPPAAAVADGVVTPSATQAVKVAYTYQEGASRRWGYVTFNGSGDAAADLLDLNPPGGAQARLSAGAQLDNGDTWDLTLAQYNQGQTVSQQMLPVLASLQTNLLRYNGDVGAKLDRLDVRDNFMQTDTARLNDRLSKVESADLTEVATYLKQYEVMYQATLQATAMVYSRTLADYL